MLFKLQVCIVNYRIMTDISISKQYYLLNNKISCVSVRGAKPRFIHAAQLLTDSRKIFFPYLFVKIKTAVWIYNIFTRQSSLKDNQLSYYERI